MTIGTRMMNRSAPAIVGALVALGLWVTMPLRAQTDDGAQRIATTLAPLVERAVGLPFKHPPRIVVRNRDQVRAYLDRKIAAELPPAEMMAVQRAYRAFRLVPDSVDLRKLMVDLYAEQVAGFYDPDSSALFVVRGADPTMLRVVLAHELVHALQDQYTRLNLILMLRRQNDRQMAGQAVMEGQAMVGSFSALAPDRPVNFTQARELIRQGQASMPVFQGAPHLIQESLLFPYLAGAEFIQSFNAQRRGRWEQPFGARLPVSSEQILHADKYAAHERPMRIAIATDRADTVIYADDFGEAETRAALESWGTSDTNAASAAAGWNGDRYAVLGTKGGTAIVWAVAWDTPEDAREFERALRRAWADAAQKAGPDAARRRWRIEMLDISGIKVVRMVDAPTAWPGWARLPAVSVRR